MKRILSLATICVIACAQYPVTVLYSDDLSRTPSEIWVSSGYQTYIEFFDSVEKAGYQQDGPYAVTTQDNFVIITTKAQSGSGDLWVRVQGRTHFFNLKTTKGSSLRPYRVERERPSKAVPPAPANKLPLPANVSVQVLATTPTGGETVVQYMIRNNSSSSLTVGLGHLQLSQTGQPRLAKPLYGSASLVLAPGGFTAGAFSLSVSGTFSLDWDFPEVGTSRVYTFSQTLTPGTTTLDTRP